MFAAQVHGRGRDRGGRRSSRRRRRRRRRWWWWPVRCGGRGGEHPYRWPQSFSCIATPAPCAKLLLHARNVCSMRETSESRCWGVVAMQPTAGWNPVQVRNLVGVHKSRHPNISCVSARGSRPELQGRPGVALCVFAASAAPSDRDSHKETQVDRERKTARDRDRERDRERETQRETERDRDRDRQTDRQRQRQRQRQRDRQRQTETETETDRAQAQLCVCIRGWRCAR